jgi:hypothetical protein
LSYATVKILTVKNLGFKVYKYKYVFETAKSNRAQDTRYKAQGARNKKQGTRNKNQIQEYTYRREWLSIAVTYQ